MGGQASSHSLYCRLIYDLVCSHLSDVPPVGANLLNCEFTDPDLIKKWVSDMIAS